MNSKMGRKSSFQDATIYAAVGRALMRQGDVRLQSIVTETGVSVGSLYHRFGSRDGLLARAWLDALTAFHQRFLEALETQGDWPGLEAALATPRFCRDEPDRALILVCCRRSELITPDVPKDVAAALDRANDRVLSALEAFAEREGLSPDAASLGLVGFPLGAVKLYLPDRPLPDGLEDDVAAAYRTLYERHRPR